MKFKERVLLRDYLSRFAYKKANIQRISICLGKDEICRIEAHPQIFRSRAFSVVEANDKKFSESPSLMNYFVKSTSLNDGTDPELITMDRVLTIYLGGYFNYAE